MCGRYEIYTEDDNDEIREIIKEIERKYNITDYKLGEIFPTDSVPVIVSDNNKINPEIMKWGFSRFGGKGAIINARSESAMEKSIFKGSLLSRRCLVPSTGFYEWTHSGEKIKYLFTLPDGNILYMAGFYNTFQSVNQFVILTTAANNSIAGVHDRMPLIVSRERAQDWMEDTDFALEMLSMTSPLLDKLKV